MYSWLEYIVYNDVPIKCTNLHKNAYCEQINKVSCTQSLDHKLVQTMHSSFTITSLSLLKELSLSSTFISCATFTQTQWLLYIIDFHFFHFSACWKEVMGRPPCPHVPTPTLPLTASGVAKMLFLTLPLFVLEKVWKQVKQE